MNGATTSCSSRSRFYCASGANSVKDSIERRGTERCGRTQVLGRCGITDQYVQDLALVLSHEHDFPSISVPAVYDDVFARSEKEWSKDRQFLHLNKVPSSDRHRLFGIALYAWMSNSFEHDTKTNRQISSQIGFTSEESNAIMQLYRAINTKKSDLRLILDELKDILFQRTGLIIFKVAKDRFLAQENDSEKSANKKALQRAKDAVENEWMINDFIQHEKAVREENRQQAEQLNQTEFFPDDEMNQSAGSASGGSLNSSILNEEENELEDEEDDEDEDLNEDEKEKEPGEEEYSEGTEPSDFYGLSETDSLASSSPPSRVRTLRGLRQRANSPLVILPYSIPKNRRASPFFKSGNGKEGAEEEEREGEEEEGGTTANESTDSARSTGPNSSNGSSILLKTRRRKAAGIIKRTKTTRKEGVRTKSKAALNRSSERMTRSKTSALFNNLPSSSSSSKRRQTRSSSTRARSPRSFLRDNRTQQLLRPISSAS